MVTLIIHFMVLGILRLGIEQVAGQAAPAYLQGMLHIIEYHVINYLLDYFDYDLILFMIICFIDRKPNGQPFVLL